MKKNVLTTAIVASFIAPLAMAEEQPFENVFGGIRYEYIKPEHQDHEVNSYRIDVGTRITNNFAVDVRSQFYDSDYGDTNTLEAGLYGETEFYPKWSAFARGAIGQNFGDEYTYGSVEIGPKYRIDSIVSVFGSYKFSDSFDDTDFTRYSEWKLGADFTIDPRNHVTVDASTSVDQIEANSFSVGWVYNF